MGDIHRLHLARFNFDASARAPTKTTTGATYQRLLTLPFESAGGEVTLINYTLQAVIDHEGRDTASGHYITYARRDQDPSTPTITTTTTTATAKATADGATASQDAVKGTTSKPHNTVQWFKFNDSVVDPVDESEVFCPIHSNTKTGDVRTPYILLYQRESD